MIESVFLVFYIFLHVVIVCWAQELQVWWSVSHLSWWNGVFIKVIIWRRGILGIRNGLVRCGVGIEIRIRIGSSWVSVHRRVCCARRDYWSSWKSVFIKVIIGRRSIWEFILNQLNVRLGSGLGSGCRGWVSKGGFAEWGDVGPCEGAQWFTIVDLSDVVVRYKLKWL